MDTKPVQSDSATVLPYRISAEDLRIAVDCLRKLGPDALAAALKSKKSYVQSALQTLGLATDDLELTDLGMELAYAREAANERDVFLRVISAYRPFKRAVTECVASRAETTDLDAMVAFWGRNRIGASDQNRKDGALVLLHLCAAAGLGTLLVGRSGAKTRIAWVGDAMDRLAPGAGLTPSRDGVASPPPGASSKIESPAVANVAGVASLGLPATESFRLVFPRGYGRIELPVDLRESELSLVTAQLDAIMSLLKARIAISKIDVDVTS